MPEGCVEINRITFVQKDTFLFQNNLCLAFENQQELLAIMVVERFFFGTILNS